MEKLQQTIARVQRNRKAVAEAIAAAETDGGNPNASGKIFPEEHGSGDCFCSGEGGRGRVYSRSGSLIDYREYCTCEAGRALRETMSRLRERVAAEERTSRIAAAWESAGIPRRYRDFRLEDSPATQAAAAVQVIINPAAWLLFCGPVGTGKTGLAVGYARRWVENLDGRESIAFVDVPGLILELRSSYAPGARETEFAILRRYAGAGLLILDDLGAEYTRNADWLQEALWHVIGKRHAEMRPVIITSNCSLRDLSEPVKCGVRLADRIAESCGKHGIITVAGKSQRKAAQ